MNSPQPAQISPFKASFTDNATEADYQTYFIAGQKKLLYLVVLIVLLIDITSFLIDLYHIPDQLFGSYIWLARSAIVFCELLFLATAAFRRLEPYFILIVQIMVTAILAQLLSLFAIHEGYNFVAPVTLICTIFALYLILPFSWHSQILFGTCFSMAGLIALYENTNIVDYYRLIQWVAFSNLVGCGIAWQRHIAMRKLYISNKSLEKQVTLTRSALDRNRSLSDILTHELRNPLAGIMLQADYISRHGSNDTKKLTQQIKDLVSRSTDLIESWQDGDREADLAYKKQNHASYDIGQFVTEVTKNIVAQNSTLRIRQMDETPNIFVDYEPKMISLIVQNIIQNASKYGRSSDGITYLGIKFRSNKGRLVIRIRDFGEGISFDHQEEIFKKHFRSPTHQSNHPGRGIGLYLCRQILRSQGGDITLQNRPKYGVAFCIELNYSEAFAGILV